MKKTTVWIGLAVLLTHLSCSKDMDYRENAQYEQDYIEANWGNVGGLVTDVYAMLDYDFGTFGEAMMASATDEAQFVNATNDVSHFNNGTLNAANASASVWNNSYTAIQQCNLFLAKFLGLTFPELANNSEYQLEMARYGNYEHEMRFLRAYFYFNLVRQYGDVPLFTEVLTGEEVNSLSRTPHEEVIDFIVQECDAVISKIPVDYTAMGNLSYEDTGRANKLSVMALKARALLYAASPLFNEANDPVLWRNAALASKALLDSTAKYNRTLNAYTSIWGTNNWGNNEALFVRRIGNHNALESRNFPAGVEGGNSGNCPTQTLVDAYQMTNGKFWNEPGSGFVEANPYANRDPRLAMTVVKNGDGTASSNYWPSYNSNTIETFQGGRNGEPIANATPTGYYLRKLLDRNVDFSQGRSVQTRHSWIIYRVGEVYLNYAEAVFKALGSADATSAEFPMSAREAVNKVRDRTGVKMPALPLGLSNAEFWRQYTNERMVELAFEGHRFWDVRRWKEGAEKFSGITLLKITRNPNMTFTYTRVPQARTWNDKLYFFPIPQSERMKNPNLTQNTGY